ncbi:hypothetical protein J1605_007258 [Eschrichtius robustus]|uniref:Uncharacterized protein n=1 Tax=Eschrichtius robustus TaxID=9764 RepID=A0AB34H3M2_ESCRO|nr:hypothetical protein J1605_007258 [Eschrichtius robustus]
MVWVGPAFLGHRWCPFVDDRASVYRNEKYGFTVEGQGFPGGTVVENLPANAGDTGSSPGPGRSHMPQSNWAREPQLLSLRVWSLRSATREAAIASLVAQWLRIRLPMQGTRVRVLVREDPTCRGATKPVRHNYRA